MKFIALATLLISFSLISFSSFSETNFEASEAWENEDFDKAMKIWSANAAKGDAHAQFSLGLVYDFGTYLKQDYKTAVFWYKRAAEQGLSYAQLALSFRFLLGEGVIEDYVYAHMWANIARANGEKGLDNHISYIQEKMTPSQLEKAQDLARECVAKDYKGC